MAKYIKKVTSFEDLKKKYRDLLRTNHPDNGGDTAVMQEINAEYDVLFRIWKDRHEKKTGQVVNETAESTRSEFYTQFGWKGRNYNSDRSLKTIAQIVRSYVKEKYPTYKFSVRTSYASMCQELHVSLREAPADIYKQDPEDLTEAELNEVWKKLEANGLWTLESWYPEQLLERIREVWTAESDFFKVYTEDVAAMLDDIDDFVRSYNWEDCDGSIDYFNVNFYYFGCKPDWKFKIVPKKARIGKRTSRKDIAVA